MKLFKRVTEQRLRSYLEDIGFINKYQSGFRRNKSTDNHLFRLSQSVMESFNRGEHLVAEKAFNNVWRNGLRYKIFMLDLPTKMTHWPNQREQKKIEKSKICLIYTNTINQSNI